jgi:N-acetylneuraminic acid mutarotase
MQHVIFLKEKLFKSMLPVIALVLLLQAPSCKKSANMVSYSGSTMLSEGRASLAAAGAGNKILFAGGQVYNVTYDVSNRVDIYDVSSGTWTTAQLSEARNGLAGAAAENNILFGGGYKILFPPGGVGYISDGGASNAVDIYNISSNTWTKGRLSEAREYPAAAGAANKVLFAGGAIPPGSLNATYSASKTVDIFTLFGQ